MYNMICRTTLYKLGRKKSNFLIQHKCALLKDMQLLKTKMNRGKGIVSIG